ncbi:uridine kinase [Simkania negevensis]|uniref:Uridine kinase n=1 Tax=Simkania negevensis TaxID=83561 RepID=A0ABS3AT89_9BACT|nr:uridine kinase [Simkania negevensis]
MLLVMCAFSTCLNAQPLFVGIAGGTGSGKTTIARIIKETLGDEAIILSQDAYYRDRSGMTLAERKQLNFDHPDSIEFGLMKEHMLALKAGKSIERPSYDFVTSTRTGKMTRVSPAKVIIVEGILLLAMPEIRDILDLRIFVDVDADIRILRRVERDISERGQTLEEVHQQYLTTVQPMHVQFVEPSKRHANLIIPWEKENRAAVDAVIASLKQS